MTLSIDSRTVQPGDIFVPVKGQGFDGHDFVDDVIAKGGHILDVDLGEFAAKQRLQYDIPIIAITGSSGKTTTKDRIAALLSTKCKVLKTKENQNNEIGVPLTLLKLNKDYFTKKAQSPVGKMEDGRWKMEDNNSKLESIHIKRGTYQAAVIELGMRGLGEIEMLARIVQPTHVVITNIGVAHLGRLGSRERICQAKCEILLPTPHSQVAFLNEQDDFFSEAKHQAEKAGWRVIGFQGDPLPRIAREFGIQPSVLESLQVDTSTNRMDIIHKNGITIINDTYNANPDSVKWALNQLREFPGRKIAVLGDMLELGKDEIAYHQAIDTSRIDVVYTYGSIFREACITENAYIDKETLVRTLKSQLCANDVILVKGSRSMAMETIVHNL